MGCLTGGVATLSPTLWGVWHVGCMAEFATLSPTELYVKFILLSAYKHVHYSSPVL